MELKLNVQTRSVQKKEAKKLRKLNIIPGIVYGKHIDTPISVGFDKQEFIKAYKTGGYSTPITLQWEKIDNLVLIQDIQVDPVTDVVLHVDFLGLKKGEKVTTEVSIVLTWEAPIEKLWEGNVQQIKDAVEIEAMPKDLPQNIEVDISEFDTTNHVIFVKDLIVGKWVEILDDPDQTIVTVVAVSEDIEEETTEEDNAAWTAGPETEEDATDKKDTEEKA